MNIRYEYTHICPFGHWISSALILAVVWTLKLDSTKQLSGQSRREIKHSYTANQYWIWNFFFFSGRKGNWSSSTAAAVYQRHYQDTQPVKLIFREAALMWFAGAAAHFLSSVSSTSKFPSGLQRFLNARVHPFCVAYKVPLEKNK